MIEIQSLIGGNSCFSDSLRSNSCPPPTLTLIPFPQLTSGEQKRIELRSMWRLMLQETQISQTAVKACGIVVADRLNWGFTLMRCFGTLHILVWYFLPSLILHVAGLFKPPWAWLSQVFFVFQSSGVCSKWKAPNYRVFFLKGQVYCASQHICCGVTLF